MLRLLWHLFGATYGNIWATFLLKYLVTLNHTRIVPIECFVMKVD